MDRFERLATMQLEFSDDAEETLYNLVQAMTNAEFEELADRVDNANGIDTKTTEGELNFDSTNYGTTNRY